MALETTEKDSSIAFEKLAITSNGGDHCKIPATSFSHFKSKILGAIDEIRENIMKSETSNADKNLIEAIIAKLNL